MPTARKAVRKRAVLMPIMLYGALLSVVLLTTYFSPRAGDDVAVMVWPLSAHGRAAQVVSQAGGQLVDGARLPFIVVARGGPANLSARLYAAGALLVFDPGISAGCFTKD